MEYFIISFKALAELYEVHDPLGLDVEYLNDKLFLPLTIQRDLRDLDYFLFWKPLVHPNRRELVEVLNNFVHPTDELADLGVVGIVQPPTKVYLLALDHFRWEEVGENILHN